LQYTLRIEYFNEKDIFIAYLDNKNQGETIEGAELIDVTPTILASIGISSTKDMGGKVLHDISIEPPAKGKESESVGVSEIETSSRAIQQKKKKILKND